MDKSLYKYCHYMQIMGYKYLQYSAKLMFTFISTVFRIWGLHWNMFLNIKCDVFQLCLLHESTMQH